MMSPYTFETIMLVCFGAAWPVSIYKSYKSRRNDGKSVYFLLILLFGYMNGIVFQSLLTSGQRHWAFYQFMINAAMISVDIFLYFRNSRLMRIETKKL